MSCSHDDSGPLTKKALQEAFDIINKQDLKPSRIYMNQRDYMQIAGQKCKRCGGYFPKDWPSHPIDECDLEIVYRIMES
jgi:hypothetical protein